MGMGSGRVLVAATVLAAALGSPSASRADIYRYIDANGVVHFTNTPTSGNYSFYRKEMGARPSSAVRWGAAGDFGEIISRYASQFDLEEALIRAVIRAESNYNPQAVSSKGAIGMMQLIPETARYLQVNDPFNPEENIRGGSRYLRLMLDQFEGDLDLALAAYNAGPNAVRRYGGIPPFEETRTYVERVKTFLQNYRHGKKARL